MPAAGLVFWAFLALIQGHGIVGSSNALQEDCERTRAEIAADEATLAVEPACREIKLQPTPQNGA
jgi:hypothetical protein